MVWLAALVAAGGAAAAAWALGPLAQRVARIRAEHVPPQRKRAGALRLGLLGASDIAKFAVVFPARKSEGVLVQAVATRAAGKAEAYARELGIPRAHASMRDLLEDDGLDAIYVSVPSELHLEWGLKVLEAGKHLLLEKPLAMTAADAARLERAAADRGLVLMEAMHYQHHPLAKRAHEIVSSGELGELRNIESRFTVLDKISFGLGPARTAEQVRIKMFDRWVYCVDFIRLVANAAAGSAAPQEPVVLSAHQDGHHVEATLAIGDVPAQFVASSHARRLWEWDLRVTGDRAELFIKNFGFPFIYHRLEVRDFTTATVRTEKLYGAGESTFELQLEAFRAAVQEGGPILTTASNAAQNLQLAERVFEAAATDV